MDFFQVLMIGLFAVGAYVFIKSIFMSIKYRKEQPQNFSRLWLISWIIAFIVMICLMGVLTFVIVYLDFKSMQR